MKKEPLFKVGEKVLTREGFSNWSRSVNYGGAGWADPEDIIRVGRNYLIINEISDGPYDEQYCYFFKDWENGINEFALESFNEVRQRKIDELLK